MNQQRRGIAIVLLALAFCTGLSTDAQETVLLTKQIATKIDPEVSTTDPLPVSFHYDPIIREERLFDGSLRVHLCLGLDHADSLRRPLVAEVRLTDLRDSGRTHVRYVPLVIDRDTRCAWSVVCLWPWASTLGAWRSGLSLDVLVAAWSSSSIIPRFPPLARKSPERLSMKIN